MALGPEALASLAHLIEQTVTVADLPAPLLWKVPPAVRSALAAEAMGELDFDVAPLDEEPVTRYVLRAGLVDTNEPVQGSAHTITAQDVIADSTPLADAIARLRSRAWLFVIGPEGVTRVFTRADLQLPVVSVAAFGLIAMIETGLDQLIERTLGEGMLEPLTEKRQARIAELREERRAENIELSLATSLNLDDRCAIVAKTAPIY